MKDFLKNKVYRQHDKQIESYFCKRGNESRIGDPDKIEDEKFYRAYNPKQHRDRP